MSDPTLLIGDVRSLLPTMPDASVDCVITSPPYWGLRDYGVDGQIGLEPTPDEYVANMVAVFREVRRVLAPHGTLWLNLGDSYASAWACDRRNVVGAGSLEHGKRDDRPNRLVGGLKEKDLVGIPWRVAFALQADGWYLRSDIIWSKPNPMPESVTDRPTKAHEYVFLLSKGPRYFFDQEAVREPAEYGFSPTTRGKFAASVGGQHGSHTVVRGDGAGGRNIRSVWKIATQPYKGAHFATFPEELVRRCLLAGCPARVCRVCGKPSERVVERRSVHRTDLPPDHPHWRPARYEDAAHPDSPYQTNNGAGVVETQTLGWSDCGHDSYRPGVVLDPFGGSGTTALVADKHQRHAILVELNPEYAKQAADRLERPQATLF